MAEVPSPASEGTEDLQRVLSIEEVWNRMNAVGGNFEKYHTDWSKTGAPFPSWTEADMREYESSMTAKQETEGARQNQFQEFLDRRRANNLLRMLKE